MTITSIIICLLVSLVICAIFDNLSSKTNSYELAGFYNIMKYLAPIAFTAFWCYIDTFFFK
jgi:hypothetical protein